jgi:hypothetical protein
LYVGQPETALRLERPFLQSKTLWDAQESDRVYDEAETSKFRMLAAEDYIPNTADGLLRAYNNQTTDVVFGDFEMYKNRWYTLVLPFDASVREISAAFGYAQINVLNEAVESNEKIYMKLYNQMIPANTPFMLKIDRDINMNDESIIFEDKTIVYASDDDMYAAAENYEVPAETAVQDIAPLKNAGGTLFVGTYKGKYGKGTNGAVDGLKSNEWITRITNGNFNQGGEGVYCYPLGAYWVLAEDANPANVRLYVEEADGTITAINSVGEEVDDDAASFADGWYTVTGVKLEGEPTVSGTYIYNGQKVYLKK